MSSRVGRGAVVARGVSAAAVATFAVTVTHAAAAESLPSVLAVVVAFVAASVACVSLAGRRLSWWRLSVAVSLSQLFFHLLLSIDFGKPAGVGGAALFGHSHHGLVAEVSGPPVAAVMAVSPGMWIAHLIAATVTVLAFGFGEKAVAAVLRFACSVLRALRPLRTPPARPGRRVTGTVVRFASPSVVLSVVRRRGPPVWTG